MPASPLLTSSLSSPRKKSLHAGFDGGGDGGDDDGPRVLDPYQRALRARMINLAAARFDPADTCIDEDMLDMNAVYTRVKTQLIQRKQNPKVLIVSSPHRRFQTASLAVCLKRFGCTVVTCYSGAEAYRQHLRKRGHGFDLAIVDWELSDVGGRDLVYYEREAGGNLCFLAAVPPRMNALDVLHSGADLFLRRPLCIHLHILRELLLPNLRSSYGYPTEVMKLRSRGPELRDLLDQMSVGADPEVDMLIDEAQLDLADDDAGTVDASLQAVNRLVANMKETVRATSATHADDDADDDDASNGAADDGEVADGQQHADSANTSPIGKGGKRKASAAVTAAAAAQTEKMRKAFANGLVTFNEMKRDIATLQQGRRELETKLAAIDAAATIIDPETYKFPAEIMMTAPADIIDMSKAAACDALMRCRHFLYEIERENEQLQVDNDRLSHFKVEFEDALNRAGMTIRFVEPPQKTVSLAPEASETWKGVDPHDRTVRRPGAVVRVAARATMATVKLDNKRKSLAELRDLSSSLTNSARLRATGRDRKRGVQDVLLDANRGLEMQLMLLEDGHAAKARSGARTVKGITLSYPATLQGKLSEPTPIDVAYEASVDVFLSMVPTTNEFMARLMASHPALHAKCDAFTRNFESKLAAVNLPALFETIRTWAQERNANEIAEIVKGKREARGGAGGGGSPSKGGKVSNALVVSRYKSLNNRLARTMNAKQTKAVFRRYYMAWHTYALESERIKALDEGRMPGSGFIDEPPPDQPRRELTYAEKQLVKMAQGGSGGGDTERKSALQQYRRELAATTRDLEELRDNFTTISKERNDIAERLREREGALEVLTGVVDDKNKAVSHLVGELDRLRKQIEHQSDEMTKLSEDALDARREREATLHEMEQLRASRRAAGTEAACQADIGPRVVAVAANNGGVPLRSSTSSSSLQRRESMKYPALDRSSSMKRGGSMRKSGSFRGGDAVAAATEPSPHRKKPAPKAGRTTSPSKRAAAAGPGTRTQQQQHHGSVEPFGERRGQPGPSSQGKHQQAPPAGKRAEGKPRSTSPGAGRRTPTKSLVSDKPVPPPQPPGEAPAPRPSSRPATSEQHAPEGGTPLTSVTSGDMRRTSSVSFGSHVEETTTADPLDDSEAAGIDHTTAAAALSQSFDSSTAAAVGGIAVPDITADNVASAVPLDDSARDEEVPKRRHTQAPSEMQRGKSPLGFKIEVTSATPLPPGVAGDDGDDDTDRSVATANVAADAAAVPAEKTTVVALRARSLSRVNTSGEDDVPTDPFEMSTEQRQAAAETAAQMLLSSPPGARSASATSITSAGSVTSGGADDKQPAPFRKPRKGSIMRNKASERAKLHAERMRAARLGIKISADLSHNASALSSRRGSFSSRMPGQEASCAITPYGSAPASRSVSRPVSPSKEEAVSVAKKFDNPEIAARTIGHLARSATALKDACGIGLTFNLPDPATNPDVKEVLFEVMRALAAASDAAAAGVFMGGAAHRGGGGVGGGQAQRHRSPHRHTGSAASYPHPQQRQRGAPPLPTNVPRVPNAQKPPGGATSARSTNNWAALKNVAGATSTFGRSPLTGAFTARQPGSSNAGGGMLPPIGRR